MKTQEKISLTYLKPEDIEEIVFFNYKELNKTEIAIKVKPSALINKALWLNKNPIRVEKNKNTNSEYYIRVNNEVTLSSANLGQD